ncbi:carbohydrate esterase family 1 protein [Ceratobasidium sp. AG-Ba]|nr:carbohydrate esterase family 1 protein [Ceratobasidium sp. AG-Ba]
MLFHVFTSTDVNLVVRALQRPLEDPLQLGAQTFRKELSPRTFAHPIAVAYAVTDIPQDLQLRYQPDRRQALRLRPDIGQVQPGLLVALHYCGGSAQACTPARRSSSTPTSTVRGDVPGHQRLQRMLGRLQQRNLQAQRRWRLSRDCERDPLPHTALNVNPSRVVAAGLSSGAMMTNVMAGAYPDLIKAGSVHMGVAYGCFAGSGFWNSQCATGQLIKTPQQWGDLVRSGYSGYTGSRPKMQLWHGTVDTTLYPQNLQEEIKQWTNVFGVSQTPTSTTQNYLHSGWTRTDYGSNVQAILATGESHNMPVQYPQIIAWLGLNQ